MSQTWQDFKRYVTDERRDLRRVHSNDIQQTGLQQAKMVTTKVCEVRVEVKNT